MSDLEAFGRWLVDNKDKAGTPEYNDVADAFNALDLKREQSAAPISPNRQDALAGANDELRAVIREPSTRAAEYAERAKGAVRSGAEFIDNVVGAGQKLLEEQADPTRPTPPIAGQPPAGTPERAEWEVYQKVERKKRSIRKRNASPKPWESGSSMGAAAAGGAYAAHAAAPYARPLAGLPYIGPIASTTIPMLAGAYGAATGLYAHGALAQAAKDTGFKTPYADVTQKELRDRAYKEGQDDLMFSGALSVAGNIARPIGRYAIDTLTGISKEHRLYAKKVSDELGIGLSPVNLSDRGLIRGWNKIAGSLPWIGKPAQDRRDDVLKEVASAVDGLFMKSGPYMQSSEVAGKMVEVARDRYAGWRRIGDKKYKAARDAAKDAGPIVPVLGLQDKALRLADEAERLVGRSAETGKPIDWKATEDAKAIFDDAVNNVMKYDDVITVDHMAGLKEGLEASIDKLKGMDGKTNGGYLSLLIGFLREAQAAELSVLKDKKLMKENPAGVEAVRLMSEADKYWRHVMSMFDTTAAGKFRRVDPYIFTAPGKRKRGAPGVARPDEIYDAVFSTNSKDAQKELLALVGRPAYGQAVSTHVMDAFQDAAKHKDGFDAAKFLQSTGLLSYGAPVAGKGARKTTGMNEAYKVAGIDPDRLVLFADVMSKLDSSMVRDASAFLQRRGGLGGVRSIVKALGPGAVTSGSATVAGGPAALLATAAMWWFTRELNSPVFTRLMRDAQRLDPGTQAFRNAMARLVRLSGDSVFQMAEDTKDAAIDMYDNLTQSP